MGVLAASSSSILIRYAQQDGIDSLAIAAWRMTLASLVLLPMALATRRREFRRLAPRSVALALLAGLFLAVHFTAWITSLEHEALDRAPQGLVFRPEAGVALFEGRGCDHLGSPIGWHWQPALARTIRDKL